MTRPNLARASSSSTLSCITVGGDVGEVSSVAIPPSPYHADDSRVSARSHKSTCLTGAKKRVRRARSSIENYNEHILSGTAKKPRRNTMAPSRAISGQTFVASSDTGANGVTENGVKTLDLECSRHAAAGFDLGAPKRRKSTRLELVDKATGMVNGVATILGKRSKDPMKTKIQVLKSERRSSLRPRHESSVSNATAQVTDKRSRVSGQSNAEAPSLPTSSAAGSKERKPPKLKVWLAQGLYVGQHRNFDPRLTESKNKIKAASREGVKQEKPTLLPLPMFAGQRLLDRGRTFRLPFDVFAPLPPGQPKPEEWRKTQKNVFIGDAASIWKKNKLQEVSRCICKPETGCDDDCQNRFMFYECDESNCKLGGDICNNRSFESLRQRCKAGGKYNIGVEVIKTLDRGYGVRSNRTFDPNQIIVEYAGEIITQDESDERMNTRYKDNECYYLMLFDQNMIIDATRGSIARFVNHSCEPNCRMVKWTVAGKPRMALFAGDRGIMSGEELTYDYNFDPFSAKNVQQCRCGASKCRGVLGPKPKEMLKPKEEKSSLKALVTGTKRKLHDVLSRDSDVRHDGAKKKKLSSPANAKIAKGKARWGKRLAEPHVSTIIQTTKLNEKKSKESSATSTTIGKTRAVDQLTAVIRKTSTADQHSALRSSLSSDQKIVEEIKRHGCVKTTAASIRWNVVRTVRGSRRAAAAAKLGCIKDFGEMERTIKVIDENRT